MNASKQLRIRIDPISEESRRLIREELASLLQNLRFTSSKRYPALLKYVVERTLEGKSEDLKERIVGIEVFHRSADYDTNSDTTVRVTAGEVRKRLTLIYHEHSDEHPLQIILPVGSYVPEFYLGTNADTIALSPPADPIPMLISKKNTLDRGSDQPPVEAGWTGFRSKVRLKTSLAIALVLVGAGLASVWLHVRAISPATSVERFWQPARASSSPIILCAGASVPSTTSSGFTEADKTDDYPYVSVVTAGALIGLSSLFARDATPYLVQPSSSTTLADMRTHPTVLIGAYNNKWTVMMLNDLRYRFTAKPVNQIYDSQNPAKIWSRPDALPYKDKDDYAIVARFHDQLTDNTVFVIAGVGKNGTEAAAQFVTTPRYLDMLYQRLPPGTASKNIEVVLKTTVVDSKTSAPLIEAVTAW